MRIKKHTNKNEYLLTEAGLWVRNFAKTMVPYADINELTGEHEYRTMLENEMASGKMRRPWIDTERVTHRNIVIISDGYRFKEVHRHVAALDPRAVAVMAVNGALASWTESRGPNYYVINNPYRECMKDLPKSRFPKCITSTRTYPAFLEKYRGNIYRYMPVPGEKYAGPPSYEVEYQIDDYRNPVCAAIGLAYRFGVEKLLLACCDDSFDSERPGAVALKNGLFTYPQQTISHSLTEGNLFWLRRATGAKVGACSDGPEYRTAAYIKPEDIGSFFEDRSDG